MFHCVIVKKKIKEHEAKGLLGNLQGEKYQF